LIFGEVADAIEHTSGSKPDTEYDFNSLPADTLAQWRRGLIGRLHNLNSAILDLAWHCAVCCTTPQTQPRPSPNHVVQRRRRSHPRCETFLFGGTWRATGDHLPHDSSTRVATAAVHVRS
jgi:hypothetical protein